MADRRRIVTFSPGGRPVLEVDLETAPNYQAIQDTFAYQPGQQNPQSSREPGRFGGQNVVGEQNDNGTISWQALVRGTTADQAAANIETLLAAVNRTAQGRLLEWRPDGNTYSSYFRVAGPGTWKPTIMWRQWQGVQSMVVDVSFPVRPLVLWERMTIADPYDVDSTVDYVFDAATAADIAISSGNVQPVVGAALTVERRARHVARGYTLLEGQATIKGTLGSTVTGYKVAVTLRAAATTYVEVYVDDNGVNSRLRIDVVIAGVRTNRASTNLGAQISNVNPVWVRGRIEGQKVIAEYFAVEPSPMIAPATTNNYTLSGGEQSSLVAGNAGWGWVPQHAGARLDSFEFLPYTWRNLILPQAIDTLDAIPGTAPALADVFVTPSGSANAPVWALIAWGKNPAQVSTAPAVFEAESVSLSGWASSVQAGSRGGNDARATTSGAGTFSLSANVVVPELDDFTDGQVDVEVWALVLLSSTLVNPRLAAFNVGTVVTTSTQEFGATGKLLTKPSSGTVRRFVRLGVLTFTAAGVLKIQGTVEAGSSGVFGVDYVVPVLARRRAAMITGVSASDVAPFVPSTAELTKQVRSDLSAQVYVPLGTPERTVGLGGALIQPSPVTNRWMIKLSSLVPDDPASNASTEELAHPATVSLDVTPRSYMLRGA